MTQVRIEEISYQGWANCLRVTNGIVEAIATTSIGPRIMRFGFEGGQNLFWEQPEALGRSGEAEWQLRGGHRIWTGPEDRAYSYMPDNGPVQAEVQGDRLVLTQPVEPETGLQKEIEIAMAPAAARVRIVHRIRNRNRLPVEIAPWALSMMAAGGVGVTGFPPRGTHPDVLEPTNPLILWAFSDLSDPRWGYTRKYLLLRQDPGNASPTKLGHFNEKTWGAYALHGDLFLKQHRATPGLRYPDLGCSFEIFANERFLELETLGPIATLRCEEQLEHVEDWSLHRAIHLTAFDDAELDRVVEPLIEWE